MTAATFSSPHVNPPPGIGPPPADAPPPPRGVASWRPPKNNDARKPGRSIAYLAGTALVVGAAAISLIFFDQSPLGALPILFLLIVPFEKIFPRHRGQKVRREAIGTDVAYLLSNPVVQALGILVAIPVAVLSFAWLPGLALRPLVALLPGPVQLVAGILLFDVAIYWVHRWSHEVGFLWRFHAIHHSPETLDWVSGFRLHPFDGAIVAPPFIFLIAAGFSTEFSGVLAVIQFLTGLFLHANVRWRLRPLSRIIITPEFHHWHHANEPEAVHTNYSVFLPAWDVLFGTFYMPKNRRPQRYGVDEYIPAGIAAQLRHPLRGMVNPVSVLRHPVRSTKAGYRHTRVVVADVKKSTLRPTARSI